MKIGVTYLLCIYCQIIFIFVHICRGFYSRELFPLLNNLDNVEVKEIADMLIKHLLLNILFVTYRQIQNISPSKDSIKTSEKCRKNIFVQLLNGAFSFPVGHKTVL